MKKNNFLKRLEMTPLSDIGGRGKNLREVISVVLQLPQDQPDENFRKLLRMILETESGVTGEELAKKETPLISRRETERF